jgi:predicted RND superfamily exporter protein
VIALFVLLLLTFRDIRLSLLALLPLGVGTLLTLGLMGLAGIKFNPANSVFLPIIVGAGVEYGIVILHRWQEGRMLPGQLPLSTGKGVILAALTTTVGFGSLIICRHRGIFSLGLLSFVGSLFVLAAAVLLVPAVLSGMTPPPPAAEKEE